MRHLATIAIAIATLVVLSACAVFTPPAPPPASNVLKADPTPAVDPLSALATFTVADLQAALADANAHGDQLSAMCYPALIQFVQSLPSSTSGTTVIGAFTAFQKARDIRNTVNAGVPNYILIGCGPLVAQVRGDILTIVARLAGGVVAAPLLP